MAYDAGQGLTNTSGATTFVTTIGASGATSSSTVTNLGAGFYLGADRYFGLELFVHSVAGTAPNLTVKLQDSADGTTYTDYGLSFSALTTAHGNKFTSTTMTDDDVPERLALRTKPGRPYVRQHGTSTGTGQIITYSVLLKQIDAPAF